MTVLRTYMNQHVSDEIDLGGVTYASGGVTIDWRLGKPTIDPDTVTVERCDNDPSIVVSVLSSAAVWNGTTNKYDIVVVLLDENTGAELAAGAIPTGLKVKICAQIIQP